jgi:SAM-dependent methyltransferase
VNEREKWDRRYAEGEYVPRRRPAPYLEEWVDRIPAGRALDVACGAGRNALRLAEAGFVVDAVDVSEVAIGMARTESHERGLNVNWQVADIADFDLPSTYQLITVFRYRDPGLWPRLEDGLDRDGWILVEHHFKTHRQVLGPKTQDFRLDPGELLRAFSSLRIVHYAETIEPADDPAQRFAIARIAACNGDPGF